MNAPFGMKIRVKTVARNDEDAIRMVKFQSRAICKNLQVLFSLLKLPLSKFLPSSHKNNPRSILVLCIAHIGDFLCLVPSLCLLKALHPTARISVLVPPTLFEFLKKRLQGFDFVPYEEKEVIQNLNLYLRVKFYDVAYVFWNKRELLLACAIGARDIVTYDKFNNKGYGLLGSIFLKTPAEVNLERYFCSLIVEQEGELASKALACLHLTRKGFSIDFAVPRDKTIILHACCRSPNRCLPPSYWKVIAGHVSDLGFSVVFTGNGEEERRFIEECDPENRYQHAVGIYTIDELAVKLSHSELLVTVDTGIMHLAKFAGIKILVLCGGSEPRRIAPSEFFDREENTLGFKMKTFFSIQSQYPCKAKSPHCQRLLPEYCYHWDGKYSECMKAFNLTEILKKVDEILFQKNV